VMVTAPSGWTDARLTRLLERYRLRYWPTSRRLSQYRVQAATLEGSSLYGRCNREARVLLVDVSKHQSGRHIGATLLHEMVHAVVGRGGHHAPFWNSAKLVYLRAASQQIQHRHPHRDAVRLLFENHRVGTVRDVRRDLDALRTRDADSVV
jgi:hypothetical protein